MKKKLLVAGCLIVFGLVIAPKGANAEEQETIRLSASGVTRGAPQVKKVTLNSGQAVEIEIGAFKSDMIFSKYVVKVAVDSTEKESFVFRRDISYPYQPRKHLQQLVYDNKATFFISALDYKFENASWEGREYIRITNYSAQPLKYTLAVNSGLQLMGSECVDYSDIDFNL
ncbi:hypothetical protein ACWOC1_10430 [Enterococcus quebecensis]|uniref:Uncharacterized protein n=1 Tax=Enterococcus quebecensis TaxID=903983 RepID=A0A1E5H1H6_9ENTE|nr:hypothetical protein [Enterococcus quebecensis]OEG18868.1 hypothetical protein BCR23_13080 [Enterococcus quebecensis]OJG71315.1 hypothetical protein RV12_GL001577 [Enterococcus quebecensis]